MKISKLKKSQILRYIIQLIFFLILPVLYAMAFGELKIIYKMIIEGNFNFIQAFPSLIEVSVIMILTIAMGRWFCGWICAFGSYNDFIYFISKKLFKINFKVNEKVDSILKYVKYVVLIFIIIISWTMGSKILEGTSPWDAFGQITDLSTVFSTLLMGFILLVLITIGAAFIERFFCRYLCPLGAVFAIVSKLGIVKINKPTLECGKCKACTMKCSMGLKLYENESIKGGDCINCLKCTEVCPRNNANVNILGKDVDSTMASSIAMATMLGVYGVTMLGVYGVTMLGNNMINKYNFNGYNTEFSNKENTSKSISINETVKYKDGTYTGSAKGFKGGTTKVSVNIANDKIMSIETISNGDTPKYYHRVEGTIINNIISKQTSKVDTVSGATYSSKGIISAVADALSQAKI